MIATYRLCAYVINVIIADYLHDRSTLRYCQYCFPCHSGLVVRGARLLRIMLTRAYYAFGFSCDGIVQSPIYIKLSCGFSCDGIVQNPIYIQLLCGFSCDGIVQNPVYIKLSCGFSSDGIVQNPIYIKLSCGFSRYPIGEIISPR